MNGDNSHPENTQIEAPVLDTFRRREWYTLACLLPMFYVALSLFLSRFSCMEMAFDAIVKNSIAMYRCGD